MNKMKFKFGCIFMLTIIGNLTIYSQEEVKIGSKENVIITYQLTKLVEKPQKR